MKPLVSVCCITYNHEKYIADAIESFLMQKTDFPIEIIIHDDASTDNTANIIREYEGKYPDIIKPIYQSENQYSQGKKILSQMVYPKVKGKYVATCEGDDFWTDPFKLQKQVDILELHEDYSFCFHGVSVVDIDKKPLGRYLGPYGKGCKEYTMKHNVKGGFVHASSRVMRFKYFKQDMPNWYLNARHGDYALALYLSANGKAYFIDEVMSSYRTGVEDSMMTKLKQNYSKENEIKYHMQRIITLNEADEYYNFKFHDALQEVNLISEVKILLLKNKFNALARYKYKMFFKQEGFIAMLKMVLLTKFPRFASLLVELKGKWVLCKS